MVNRILMGEHPTFGMGGYVSVPTVNVMTANKFQMSWSTMFESLQILSSGSVAVPSTSSDSDVNWSAAFTWTDLGYYPVIFVSYPSSRTRLQYLSTNSARVRADGDFGGGDSGGTCYFVVTRTVKP